jgi:GH15 family glucan-1,4-alpha-glucosidase
MAWVAFDRAVKLAELRPSHRPVERWRAVRDAIHTDVCTDVCRQGFDAELGSFVQSYGSKLLDAGLLMLAPVGFLPPSGPRIQGTVAAIERRLLREGFVLRYETAAGGDGLPPGEGAFLACSFWLADKYILQGRRQEARRLFRRLAKLTNDVGLLAEEYDPHAGRQVGNFPQAFSHVALVNTALSLSRPVGPTHQRARWTPVREPT